MFGWGEGRGGEADHRSLCLPEHPTTCIILANLWSLLRGHAEATVFSGELSCLMFPASPKWWVVSCPTSSQATTHHTSHHQSVTTHHKLPRPGWLQLSKKDDDLTWQFLCTNCKFYREVYRLKSSCQFTEYKRYYLSIGEVVGNARTWAWSVELLDCNACLLELYNISRTSNIEIVVVPDGWS